MTRIEETTGPPRPTAAGPSSAGRARWWGRPWVAPLGALVALFFLYALPPWLSFDPAAQERVVLNPGVPQHYALVLLHVASGVVTYVTVVLQLWPWLRVHHPAVHRVSGRFYVFAGIVPAALLALVLAPLGGQMPIGKVGSIVWGLLALGTTIAGWRAARQRRWADHRRWMIYSFALALGVVAGRFLAALVFFAPGIGPRIFEVTQGQIEGFWLGWAVNLALAHWWLRRTAGRPLAMAR